MFKKLVDNLFGGSDGPSDGGIYLYIKLNRTDEIVRLRLDPQHELNPGDEGGYFSKKLIVGPQSFKRAEATFHFDSSKHFTGADIEGGELSNNQLWEAYNATLNPSPAGTEE